MNVRIGISGWTYAPWRGVFYPEDLAQREELAYAARTFSSIEINGTHYSLQRPESFLRWKESTPPGFVFSVKASRYITHMRRLRDIATPLANFFASGPLALGPKLGPILWQFPPSFRFDSARMDDFFARLPHTTHAAAELARRRDDRMRDREWLKPGANRRIRHCVEIRHESFMDPEFFRILRRHRVAFVFADTAGKWPYAEDLTSDFFYLRLHGDAKLYESGYTPRALDHWAERIRAWCEGRPAADARVVSPQKKTRPVRAGFVYFDNDMKVKAPRDALAIAKRLGLEWKP
jgi:uncharacterized protein YecE (DUF72 family)